jgi:hypothetical protein
MWVNIAVTVVLALAVCTTAAVIYGSLRWKAGTRDLRARLESARVRIQPRAFDVSELAGLPAPVQRYFRVAIRAGQPIVAAVSMEHTGTFAVGETAGRWKPFTSTQRVVTSRPGFDWDARISILPGLPVRVHDAYVAGEGILHATILGLITAADVSGTPEVAEGELLRFFAEAAWYPTALLPSQGVHWKAVDDTSARATLRDGKVSVTLLFRFDDAGLIGSVRAEARGRVVDGVAVPTPWEGRLWGYELRDGMRVPLQGEVAWHLPDGQRPYWRGRITSIRYEFSD